MNGVNWVNEMNLVGRGEMREWDELGEYDDWGKLGKWDTFCDWGELVE